MGSFLRITDYGLRTGGSGGEYANRSVSDVDGAERGGKPGEGAGSAGGMRAAGNTDRGVSGRHTVRVLLRGGVLGGGRGADVCGGGGKDRRRVPRVGDRGGGGFGVSGGREVAER